MYLLFYSKKCKYSRKFIDLVYDIGEGDFFKMVDVAKINGKYPPIVKKYGITEVPTAIINGELYAGPCAFKWLEGKIKNMNHGISSQNTRVNKTPNVCGYSADNSSAPPFTDVNNSVESNGSFSSINSSHKIETPDADSEYEKSSFVLHSDNITGMTSGVANTVSDDRPDRSSRMDSDLEEMIKQRSLDVPKRRV